MKVYWLDNVQRDSVGGRGNGSSARGCPAERPHDAPALSCRAYAKKRKTSVPPWPPPAASKWVPCGDTSVSLSVV